jgi:hypothetical protein
MCTAVKNHCPSCCTNHGGVYSRSCPVLYQLRPGQLGFVHINHTIDEQNPKIALETCDRCKRRIGSTHGWRTSGPISLSSSGSRPQSIPLARSARITKWKKNSHSGSSHYFKSVLIKPGSGSGSGSPNDDVSRCQPFAQLYCTNGDWTSSTSTLKGLKLGDLAVSEGALDRYDSTKYRVLVSLLFII